MKKAFLLVLSIITIMPHPTIEAARNNTIPMALGVIVAGAAIVGGVYYYKQSQNPEKPSVTLSVTTDNNNKTSEDKNTKTDKHVDTQTEDTDLKKLEIPQIKNQQEKPSKPTSTLDSLPKIPQQQLTAKEQADIIFEQQKKQQAQQKAQYEKLLDKIEKFSFDYN